MEFPNRETMDKTRKKNHDVIYTFTPPTKDEN